jgi:hypothetical protein
VAVIPYQAERLGRRAPPDRPVRADVVVAGAEPVELSLQLVQR